MRIVYAGTSGFARVVLERLIDAGLRPVAVYTRADRPAGRGLSMRASPVKVLAGQRLGRDCPVIQPENFSDPDTIARLAALEADIIVTVSYGLLLPQTVLDLARWVAFNVHPSLLPRWRGAAPITYTIASRDELTGVSLARMESTLDTGAILVQHKIPVLPAETTGELSSRLSELAATMTVDFLGRLTGLSDQDRRDALRGTVQDSGRASYAPRLTPAQSRIDWNAGGLSIEAWIRALQPRPRAHTFVDGRKLIIHRAHLAECRSGEEGLMPGYICPDPDSLRIRCADGVLCPDRVQLPGGRQLDIAEFLRGHPPGRWAGLICKTPQDEDRRA